jgi:transcription elongation factor Elf1
MQKGQSLHFKCIGCEHDVAFSIFDLNKQEYIACTQCEKKYSFNDPDLIRQIKKFEALCRQVRESEEILGHANIGVDVGEHHVKVPYKLLLTRLNSNLDLSINGKTMSIQFRMEPIKDCCSPA